MRIRTLLTVNVTCMAMLSWAGGEIQQPVARQPVPTCTRPQPAAIAPPALHVLSPPVGRNMPLPAPYREKGCGKELNDFYGPTYYYPSEHNSYEGLHPQYYPFFLPKGLTNYKKPGTYCPGKLCGSSSSLWYWDSYDDWKRGERYEQHQ